MFVRCVGQLTITVALCGCPGLLPTRSPQQCNRAISVVVFGLHRQHGSSNFIWPVDVCNGVALRCLTCLPSCYGSCECTYVLQAGKFSYRRNRLVWSIHPSVRFCCGPPRRSGRAVRGGVLRFVFIHEHYTESTIPAGGYRPVRWTLTVRRAVIHVGHWAQVQGKIANQ